MRRWRSGPRARLVVAVAIAGAAAVTAGLPAAARTIAADTGVVNMSNTPFMAEGEVPVAVNPLNPQEVAAISNTWQADGPGGAPLGNGLQSVALYISHDGGRTWKTNRIQQGGVGPVPNPLGAGTGGSPEFTDLGNTVTTDADVAWDHHGNLYVETGCLHTLHAGLGEIAHIWHSVDGGETFDGPYNAVTATQGEHEELDRPWLAIDNSGGPRDGTLYLAFETGPFTDDPPKVFVKHSTDHGKTWSATVRVDDGTYQTQFNPRNRPVVDASGTLYIAYDRAGISNTPFNAQQTPIQLVVARSVDGGQTFQRTVADDNITRVQSPDEALPAYSEMIPAIAADPTRAGRIAVAWPEAINPLNSRIMLRQTADGGAHWSERVDIADDPATVANQHDHVALHWLADGRLATGWRDRRGSAGTWNDAFHEWVRLFTPQGDGLRPVGRTVEFTTGAQPAELNYRGSTMPDEFQGLTTTSAAVMATWAQPAGKHTDVVFRSVPLAAFTTTAAPAGGGPIGLAALPGTSTGPPPGPLAPGLLVVAAAVVLRCLSTKPQ